MTTARAIHLGLRANWRQFTLLVAINAFVGGVVGVEMRHDHVTDRERIDAGAPELLHGAPAAVHQNRRAVAHEHQGGRVPRRGGDGSRGPEEDEVHQPPVRRVSNRSSHAISPSRPASRRDHARILAAGVVVCSSSGSSR